jgi:Calcineurin-like phosphoesterase
MGDLTRPTGKEIIRRLEAGKLPRMVDWFDPMVLVMVGVRTLISSTIGEYADQRPMQEAADGQRDMNRVTQRHDYSHIEHGTGLLLPPEAVPENPYYPQGAEYAAADPDDRSLMESRRGRRLKLESGALWVDFIADLGDGFEATYAMAYLLARPELEVQSATRKGPAERLPAGQILIFGGDLAYPNATEEEYRTRCLDPYDWAFPFTSNPDKPGEREPKRELFFIAGNHDWYDGLAAFSNQFCYETTAVGGWRCSQQRSYFALNLPYNWWIWGVDVALSDSLDVAQRHYFEAIVAKRLDDAKRNKIIIVLHAPDWQKKDYKALSMICQIARSKGEVCAIIAGDLHHYSRYQSEPSKVDIKPITARSETPVGHALPDMHLITSGGGGAFAHPTHDQKGHIDVRKEVAGAARVKKLAHKGAPDEAQDFVRFSAGRRQFYPTKNRSRLLALKNVFLPFHNWRFSAFVGVVYMIFAWVFQIAVADPTVAIKNAQHVNIEMQCVAENPDNTVAAINCNEARKRAFDKKLRDLTAPASASASPSAAGKPSKAAKQEVETGLEKLFLDVDTQGGWWNYFWNVLSVQLSPDRILSGMLASPAFFFLIAGLWVGLVQYADVTIAAQWLRWPIKLTLGTGHAAAHLTVLLATNSLLSIVYNFFAESQSLIVKVSGTGLYTLLMIAIGGILGAFVFGIYWVLTSVLFGMHQDCFSALGIRNYKNFLRMKFEEDKLTIYPVALDKVPGRMDWQESEEGKTGKGSLIEPKKRKKLRPRLIETPIIITRAPIVPHI